MNRNQLHAHTDAGFRQVDPRQAMPSTVARSFILAATFIVIVTAETYLSGGSPSMRCWLTDRLVSL